MVLSLWLLRAGCWPANRSNVCWACPGVPPHPHNPWAGVLAPLAALSLMSLLVTAGRGWGGTLSHCKAAVLQAQVTKKERGLTIQGQGPRPVWEGLPGVQPLEAGKDLQVGES